MGEKEFEGIVIEKKDQERKCSFFSQDFVSCDQKNPSPRKKMSRCPRVLVYLVQHECMMFANIRNSTTVVAGSQWHA